MNSTRLSVSLLGLQKSCLQRANKCNTSSELITIIILELNCIAMLMDQWSSNLYHASPEPKQDSARLLGKFNPSWKPSSVWFFHAWIAAQWAHIYKRYKSQVVCAVLFNWLHERLSARYSVARVLGRIVCRL